MPSADLNVRLISPDTRVPAYWGRDQRGRRLLVVRLEGDHRQAFSEGRVSVRGLETDLRDGDVPGHQRLVLTLEQDADADLFAALCGTLSADVALAESSATGLATVLSYLRRWKAFLANRNARILSWEEVRGLFAELWFLRTLVRTLAGTVAVQAWVGPEGIHQDFIFGDRAVEVKSLSASDPRTVRISSENQLETVEGRLFLLTVRLVDVAGAGSLSLNQAVAAAREEIGDPIAVEQFDRKLFAAGYLEIAEYDSPLLSVTSAKPYRVEGGFPKIVRSELPSGVLKVAYQIQLEAIEPYGCDISEVVGG